MLSSITLHSGPALVRQDSAQGRSPRAAHVPNGRLCGSPGRLFDSHVFQRLEARHSEEHDKSPFGLLPQALAEYAERFYSLGNSLIVKLKSLITHGADGCGIAYTVEPELGRLQTYHQQLPREVQSLFQETYDTLCSEASRFTATLLAEKEALRARFLAGSVRQAEKSLEMFARKFQVTANPHCKDSLDI